MFLEYILSSEDLQLEFCRLTETLCAKEFDDFLFLIAAGVVEYPGFVGKSTVSVPLPTI